MKLAKTRRGSTRLPPTVYSLVCTRVKLPPGLCFSFSRLFSQQKKEGGWGGGASVTLWDYPPMPGGGWASEGAEGISVMPQVRAWGTAEGKKTPTQQQHVHFLSGFACLLQALDFHGGLTLLRIVLSPISVWKLLPPSAKSAQRNCWEKERDMTNTRRLMSSWWLSPSFKFGFPLKNEWRWHDNVTQSL